MALAAVLFTAVGASVQFLPGAEAKRIADRIDGALDGVFVETGVDRRELTGQVREEDSELTLTVPDDATYTQMNVEITGARNAE